MKKGLTLLLLVFAAAAAFGQSANAIIKEGNEKYNQQDYSGAQKSYEQALAEDPESDAGTYNLGNTYYEQKQYDAAIEQYQRAADQAKDPETRAQALHNLGNAYLQQKKYEESINAYKQSLRNLRMMQIQNIILLTHKKC